jgi:hypothetical protein
MTKKIHASLILYTLCMMSITAQAQASSHLFVHGTNGTVTSFNLDNLQKITFTADNIVVQPVADSASPFAYNAVQKLTFESFGTSIKDLAKPASDRIYYNPSSESIHLTSDALIGNLAVYNLQGVMLKRINVQSTQAEISLSGLPAGIYIVKTATSVKKIVKN